MRSAVLPVVDRGHSLAMIAISSELSRESIWGDFLPMRQGADPVPMTNCTFRPLRAFMQCLHGRERHVTPRDDVTTLTIVSRSACLGYYQELPAFATVEHSLFVKRSSVRWWRTRNLKASPDTNIQFPKFRPPTWAGAGSSRNVPRGFSRSRIDCLFSSPRIRI